MRISVTALGIALAAGTASAQLQLTTVRLAPTFIRPLYVTAPPGDTQRLFIVEQRGSGGTATRGDIKVYNIATGTVNAAPFLSVNGLTTGSEQGLLGLAFHPNYANNGFFYVDYTDSVGTTHITRYQVSANPDVANAASASTVITQTDNYENHNGGWLGFGPDGYLYVAWGDGGNFCDTPDRNAQNLNMLWGKLLRLDVNTAPYAIPPTNPFFAGGGRGEIWAYGLRNPSRCSFDRQTGDLYIGDVGQDYEEEVDFQPANGTPPFVARNYGWNCREGFVCASTSPSNCNVSNCPSCQVPIGVSTDPIYAYVQAATSHCAITGGYVYRGCAMPNLRGTYFFADYCSAKIWSFRYVGGVVTQFTDRTAELVPSGGGSISLITSFGEDANGEIYICQGSSTTGAVFKIVPRCAANCDASTDIPTLNVADFTCFLLKYASGDCYANCDASTTPPTLNVADFTCYLQKYAAGCSVP